MVGVMILGRNFSSCWTRGVFNIYYKLYRELPPRVMVCSKCSSPEEWLDRIVYIMLLLCEILVNFTSQVAGVTGV